MATQPNGRTKPPVDEFHLVFRMRELARPAAQAPCRPVAALRAVRGLLLEAGNILYDDTAWRHWLLRLLMRLGLRAEYGPFFRVFDRDYLDDVHCGRRTFDEAMNDFLIAAGLDAGQAEEVCRALNSQRRRNEAGYRPLIGVRATLAGLRAAGLTLGILCNSERTGDAIRQRLAELLDESPWTTVVSSRDLGCTMPSPACYKAALEAVHLPAADVAFVGRDARELRGAKAQGLATIAFNADADAHADVHLQRFEDLLELTQFSPAPSVAA